MPRQQPSVLHLDMDAFFAAVEQRDKPSLRGRPVIVGGTGPRGVVSTASYEARVFGVRSAMAVWQARRLCPKAAVLTPRFAAYQAVSAVVMATLAELSPLVEPMSLDEAFVDLAAGDSDPAGLDVAGVTALGEELRARVRSRTGLTCSVGAGTSKLMAKIASDLHKPDGLLVVAPGEEQALLDPLPVTRLWGVGPVTARALASRGVRSVADLRGLAEDELVRDLGAAAGRALFRLARAQDDRAVDAERASKSIGAEETFPTDVTDRSWLGAQVERMLVGVTRRLVEAGIAARTVTVKVRRHDFDTLTRSHTLPAATDDAATLRRAARTLLGAVDVSDGVRLVGVSVSGFEAWSQQRLEWEAGDAPEPAEPRDPAGSAPATLPLRRPGGAAVPALRLLPGLDVAHEVHGRGWVQGAGHGRVTLRLEAPGDDLPGRVVTVASDDPRLTLALATPKPS